MEIANEAAANLDGGMCMRLYSIRVSSIKNLANVCTRASTQPALEFRRKKCKGSGRP